MSAIKVNIPRFCLHKYDLREAQEDARQGYSEAFLTIATQSAVGESASQAQLYTMRVVGTQLSSTVATRLEALEPSDHTKVPSTA